MAGGSDPTRIVFLDQNAWVALSKGAWDKISYPKEHAALIKIVDAVKSGSVIAPLTAANIYETFKINKPARRANMARLLALVSGGRVFRGRRRVLRETLSEYIANELSIHRSLPDKNWFLSDFWFESVSDYSSDAFGFEISSLVLDFFQSDPARALYEYLLFDNEEARLEAVRRYSSGSAKIVSRIEARRAMMAGESLATRKRAYSARLIIDEIEFILETGRKLGLDWGTIHDVGSPLVRGIATNVPIFKIERELAVRLETQSRAIENNDLRDMASFTTVLPFADVIIAEKTFVNLSIQARLGQAFGTELLTSIFDF